MTPESKSLSERLLDGARMLGALWRSKHRCELGWSLGPRDIVMEPCSCEKKTKFCQGRHLFIILAFQNGQGGDAEFGDYGLAFTLMSTAQWDATGLTMVVESEMAGALRIGQKSMISAVHLRKLSADPASAVSIFSLTRTFPKARVEGIVEPPPDKVA